MIYGFIPEWMAKENPAFAEAVSRYYSLSHGKVEDAAIGEVAWFAMAVNLLSRRDPLSGLDYGPLLRRIIVHLAKEQEVWSGNNYEYLQHQAEALRLHAEGRPHEWSFVEYIWEAYFFLRQRDGEDGEDGEGPSLPFKEEVRRKAALIRAFCEMGFRSALPDYLRWREVVLTKRQIEEIEQLQKHYLRKGTPRHWTRLLELAGLKGLPQQQAGGRRRCPLKNR
jgi:hypothetical protein